jgi:hypothetical protein
VDVFVAYEFVEAYVTVNRMQFGLVVRELVKLPYSYVLPPNFFGFPNA